MPHGEEFSNTILVKVDGAQLPDDVKPLLVTGYVDDSTHVPDLFLLRFSDESGTVLAKARFEIGAKVELSLQSTQPGGPGVLHAGEVTAIEVDVSEAGVFTVVRGLDASHRLFRGTRVEAYVNMTASDIVKKVAQRAGLPCEVEATTTMLDHTTQDGINDWDFLHRLAAENDRLLTMADGKLRFVARPPAAEAPGGTAGSRDNPLVLERGVSLVNLRGTLTSDGQVAEGRGPRLGPPAEEGGRRRQGRGHREREAGGRHHARRRWPRSSTGRRTSSAWRPSPSRTRSPPWPARWPTTSPAASPSWRVRRAATPRCAPGPRSSWQVCRPRSPASTCSRRPGTSSPRTFGYRTTFTASSTSERSLFGAANATSRQRAGISGVVPAIVTSVQDPEHRGRVKIKLPWLADSYESWWARTVQAGARQGPRRRRTPGSGGRGAGRVRAG